MFTRGYHKIICEKMDVSTGSHIQIIQRQASGQWWWEQRSHRGRDSHSFWSAGCSVLVRDYPDWLSSPPVSHIEMENKHEIGGNSGNPVTPVTQLPTCLFSISPSFPRQMQIILGFPHVNALDEEQKWRETAPGVPRYVTPKCWVSMGLMLPSSSNFWTSHFIPKQERTDC